MSLSRSTYNPKLETAIVYILDKRPLEIMRLAKFLYLSDYLFAKSFGKKKSMTGNYVREKYGPIPEYFYPTINFMVHSGTIRRDGNTMTLVKPVEAKASASLDDQELACLDKIVRDFSDKDLNEVLKTAYATEPMEKILEDEVAMDVEKGLVGKEISFSDIETHPLLDEEEIDTSFMDTPEFQANLQE